MCTVRGFSEDGECVDVQDRIDRIWRVHTSIEQQRTASSLTSGDCSSCNRHDERCLYGDTVSVYSLCLQQSCRVAEVTDIHPQQRWVLYCVYDECRLSVWEVEWQWEEKQRETQTERETWLSRQDYGYVHTAHKNEVETELHFLTSCQLYDHIRDVQYQSKVWTHLLIQGSFFILTNFYIVEL